MAGGENESTPTRNIWQELEEWASGFAPWQKLSLAYAIRHGVLNDAQIDEAYAVFLHDNGLGDDPGIGIPTAITGRPATGALAPIRLTRIDNLRDVNALSNAAALTFSAGLTVIYGGNGTGKSGFARVLSNVCFSRAQHRILPNVYENTGERVPEADITVIDGSQVEKAIPLDEAKNDPDLKRIAVFDTSVARTHLADENPLGFKPVGFDVFPELGRVYGELAKRLSADVERRTRENAFLSSFVAPASAVSAVIAGLNAETAMDSLQQLGRFGEVEKARLEEVQRQILDLQSKSPAEALKQLTEAKSDLIILEQRLAGASAVLNDESRAMYRQQMADADAKATRAAAAGAESFKRAFFKGIGSPEWRDFLTAARSLAEIEGEGYPRENDHCLLCYRPLDAGSAALIRRFWEFLASPALREAEQAREALDVSARTLRTLELGFYSAETRVRGHVSRLNPELAQETGQLVAALVADRTTIAQVLATGTGQIAPAAFGDVSEPMKDLKEQIDGDIARLQGHSVAEALRGLEADRVLLRHRQVLSQLLPQIEIFLADARWVKKASGAPRRSLNPRHLTDKETELFRTVIADGYRDRLGLECRALDCVLPVELSARGERGQTIRSLVIKGGHRPNEILSEGEQRAVALADFLTEICLNPANAGIVLDDPVNSQDHQRKECIAQRLVKEANFRQVIVFTHDLVFLTKMAAAAEDTGAEMLTHWVERDGEGRPGQVSLNDCPATTPQYRTTAKAKKTLGEAKNAIGSKRVGLIQRGMAELRRTIEEIVPHFLLKQVVNRWTDRIIVTGLRNINWDKVLVTDLIKTFEDISAYIEGHSHTEEQAGAHLCPRT
jgi:hypothetical protein